MLLGTSVGVFQRRYITINGSCIALRSRRGNPIGTVHHVVAHGRYEVTRCHAILLHGHHVRFLNELVAGFLFEVFSLSLED